MALLAEHPEAWSVGGPIRHAATTTLGKAVAVAMSHPLGVGNARHRYPDFEGYVEGAQFPAIRRWVFDRIGMFDERLVRNQDDEFNYRIRRAGGKIYVSPRVRYSYFVRERIGQLFKQYFQYGFWRIPVIEKHRPADHAPPDGANAVLRGMRASSRLAGWWWRQPTAGRDSCRCSTPSRCSSPAPPLCADTASRVACVPVAIATMHAGYALGLGYGIWARVFHADAWDSQGKMAAISR